MMAITRRLAAAALAAALLVPAGALLGPASLEAQARPQRPPERPEQRQAIERRFHQRFLELSSRRLSLEQRQTERLGTILERGWRARKDLQRELAQERERFAAAVRDEATTDDEFRRLLATMEDLRRQEYELWVSEQRALAEFLTPRQRAMFVQMQMRAIDAVRDMRRRHSDGEGGRDRRDGDRSDDGGDRPGSPGDRSGGTPPL